MYYLIIDTCIWINLCDRFKLREFPGKITDLVEQDKVKLIVPQTVIDEWDKHKAEIVPKLQESIRGHIRNAKDLSDYLELEDDAKQVKDILNKLHSQQTSIESLTQQNIDTVEALFNHPSTIKLPITEKEILQAVDFALEDKAPFRGKNSMADALILFSFINHVAEVGLTDCIFISSNTTDFSSKDNRKIHDDLKEIFDEHEIKYFINIALAIKEIEDSLISDEDIREIEQTLQLEELQRILGGIKPNYPVSGAFEAAQRILDAYDPVSTAFETAQRILDAYDPVSTAFEAIQRTQDTYNHPVSEKRDNSDEEE